MIGETNSLHDTDDDLKSMTYELLRKDTPQLILLDMLSSSSVASVSSDHNNNGPNTSVGDHENVTIKTRIVDTTHNQMHTKDYVTTETSDMVRLSTNNETNRVYYEDFMGHADGHHHERKNNKNEESIKIRSNSDDIIYHPTVQHDDATVQHDDAHSLISPTKRLCDFSSLDSPTYSKRHKTCHLNEEQKQRNILLKTKRLFELYHASKCTQETCYESKHCAEMKQLWIHMENCCNNDPCQYPHCQSSRNVLLHYQKCRYMHCPVCSSFRSHLEHNMIESNLHDNMRQNADTVCTSLDNPTTTTPELSRMLPTNHI
jgi:TAZ zinc finger